MKHTPGPWRVVDSLKTIDCIGIYGQHSTLVAEIRDPESVEPEERAQEEETMRANGAFIVRACNAHEELLAALAEAQAVLGDLVRGGNASESETEVYELVKEAIAKAEGRT